MSNDPKQPIWAQPAPGGANPFAEVVHNPYASPGVPDPYMPNAVGGAPFQGLWREGKLLVMHKLAPLPDICVKSNVPAMRRLQRKLRWHHPALALTVLVNVLVYAILAMILSKKATIHIALSEEWFAIRRRRILYAWGIVLASVVLFIAGVAFVDQANSALPALVIIGAIFLFLGGLIYGQYATALVSPKRMTDDYIWLKGVHPDFLDRLELWQWQI